MPQQFHIARSGAWTALPIQDGLVDLRYVGGFWSDFTAPIPNTTGPAHDGSPFYAYGVTGGTLTFQDGSFVGPALPKPHFGVVGMNTGATVNGIASLRASTGSLGTGVGTTVTRVIFEARICITPLPNNDFRAVIGWRAPQYGNSAMFFLLDETTSKKWAAVYERSYDPLAATLHYGDEFTVPPAVDPLITSGGAAIGPILDTGVIAAADAWTRLRMIYYPPTNVMEFYINEVLVVSHTMAQTMDASMPVIDAVKLSGASSFTLSVDNISIVTELSRW